MSSFLAIIFLILFFYFLIGFLISADKHDLGYLLIWGPLAVRSILRSCRKIWSEE